MRKLRIVMAMGLIVLGLIGCVSPLRSPDPETRKQAVEKISDDKELFFIAMNIGVGIRKKWPEFYAATHLRNGEYPEDVRVMAVKKIKDTSFLLRCASWKDGAIYEDKASEDGCFQYKGETHDVYREEFMRQAVSPGDAVRKVAVERLAKPGTLKDVALCFDGDARKTLFPSVTHWTDPGYSSYEKTPFVNAKDNPLDVILTDIIAKETNLADIVAFVYNASESGPKLVPGAYNSAIHKLNGISSKDANGLFKKVFLEIGRAKGDNVKLRGNAPADWAWAIYQHIDDPEEEVVVAALKWAAPADVADVKKILGKVKQQSILLKIVGDEDLVERVSKDKRKTLDGVYEKIDLTPEAAKEILEPLCDNEVLLTLATRAELYSIRYAAIDKITSDAALAKIANDQMDDCPYDTSLKGCGWLDNRSDWRTATKKNSAINLRTFAIGKLKDVTALKAVRKADTSNAIKKIVTRRLAALGYSDVGEIIAYGKYDKDLFSMFAEITKSEDLTKISKEAKLKGVRLLAASKLDANVFAAVAKKELSTVPAKPAAGKMDVGGYYLGMNIEDMFAKLAAENPDVKPTIYLDGEVLCIAGDNKRDIAWATAKSLDVHWIALPPAIVKQIAGFKTGSFEDLERAVEKKLGISFGYDVIRKGNVSQKIGNLENTEGETLRYFISEIDAEEDISRSIRKAINNNSIDGDPLAALGAGLVNALEDAQQADENNANARRPMFQLPGSLQLLPTRNAAKGSLGSKGSFSKSDPFGAVLDDLK